MPLGARSRGSRRPTASPWRRATRALGAIGWLAVAALPDSARAHPVAEFLYADAGEGGASGGHVALRLGDRVYHYQRDAAGVLAIARDAWRDFAFQYRVVENRSLSATRLELPADAAERLRAHFDARVLAEWAERERLAGLRDDVALLEALSAPEQRGGVAMRGAGFFAENDGRAGADAGAGRAALASLQARIERERGAGFLPARRQQGERELSAATTALWRDTAAADDGPSEATPFSRRHGEAFAALHAIDVLEAAPALRREALRALPGRTGALGEAEREALHARQAALETSLAALIASQRPDWGFAFLLGAARLAAVAESLASGRLAVLDAIPDPLPRTRTVGAQDAAMQHLAWRRARLDAARSAVHVDPGDESALAALEREAALHGELAEALREGGIPLRWFVPPAPAGRADVKLAGTAPTRASVLASTTRAKRRLAASERAREAQRGYDLVDRNCVTELFRQVELALGDARGPLARPATLAFVPFVAERSVAGRASHAQTRRLLSQRREVAARARSESWLAALRESNTLTSTLYAPHPADSIFLFFTDDVRAARPLLGAANLATGVAAGVAGLLWSPIDGGVLLARGLRGGAASVPELFFFNIRKGTFPWAVPPLARGAGA